MNKIADFIKENIKCLIFVICFSLVALLYNLNFQTLNFVLKRGVVLEYSVSKNIEIKKEEITKKLIDMKVKFSFVEEENYENVEKYDFENQKIDKAIFVALPYKINNKNKYLIDEVSNFIFGKDNSAKLCDIGALNEFYSTPYNSFLKFLGMLFVSLFLWLIIMYLIYDYKEINQKIAESIKNFLIKQKENIKNLIQKTKEQGAKYLIKVILFDEKEEKIDYTKEIISTIVFVLAAVIAIRYFIGELRWIPSGSMRPTILEQDRVFVKKIKNPAVEVKRGDILVFYPPETNLSNSPWAIFSRLSGIFCQDIAFIKRVIGMPGDKFEIKYSEKIGEYRVYINDEPLNEPYISSKVSWTPCNKQMFCGPFEIPKDNYFMMGDNRDNSQDSRFWGFLDSNRIIGKANFMFWPISRINILTDKYFELNKQKMNNEFVKYNYILNRY